MGLGSSKDTRPEGTEHTDDGQARGPASPSQDMKQRKIVVLGCAKVGKTALTQQFTEDRFMAEYYPTVDQTLYKTVRVRGEDYHLSILDTAGQDDTSLFQPRYTIATDGYVVVFSIDDPVSFDIAKLVYDRIHEFVVDAVIVLVGNKTDLDRERQITTEQGQALAQSWRCTYIECSAKKKENVNRIFQTILEQILSREEGGGAGAKQSKGLRGFFGKP
uniref:Rheb2 n=1 Tax=Rhabdomonas costata TaxID=118010 RepID=A0A2R4IKY8_9EUGL|nr:Rheb2 [Rhabdomonas costata]